MPHISKVGHVFVAREFELVQVGDLSDMVERAIGLEMFQYEANDLPTSNATSLFEDPLFHDL